MSKDLVKLAPLIRLGLFVVPLVLIGIRGKYPNLLSISQYLRVDTFSVSLIILAILALLWPLFKPLPGYLRKIQKRWVIIVICLVLLASKIAFPSVQVDTNTIWLVAIVALLFVLPDLQSLAPYIKRIKVGDTEIELKEKIGDLKEEVEKAENAVAEEQDGRVSTEVSSEIEEVIRQTSRDPRAALLLLSSKIESQVRAKLAEAGINAPYSIIRAVELGINNGIFPPELLPAFRDFSQVRNQVAHGEAFDVDDAYILSLVSLGTKLLAVTSTAKKQISSHE